MTTRGEVPSDGENDPPDVTGHGEEVEHHEEDGAALKLGPLGDEGGVGGGGGTGGLAGGGKVGTEGGGVGV